MNKLSRRTFIKTTAASAAFPYIVPSSALGKAGTVSPSNRITVGAIGLGGRGSGLLKDFLSHKKVQVLAVCDVDKSHSRGGREKAKEKVDKKYKNKDCKAYIDFRDVVSRKDIDAIMIATPDHWHALIAIAAARSCKDIYCEKPISYSIAEGRAICDAVQEQGVVFQTGSQQRSSFKFRRACELVRNGRIGKVTAIKVGLPGKNRMSDIPGPRQIAPGFDYDMWLGPAPWAPYHKDRCHWNFRWISDYSGGEITDWSGHHIDIVQWAMNTEHSSPVEIKGTGRFPQHDLYNTVEDFHFECKYAEGFDLTVDGRFQQGIKFEGTDGTVFVSRRGLRANPESLLTTEIGKNEIHLYESNDHVRNFIECVLSRRKTIAPVEVGHRSIMVGHLGLIAIKLGRKVKWDPVNEHFVNDPEADRLLGRSMRSPWSI